MLVFFSVLSTEYGFATKHIQEEQQKIAEEPSLSSDPSIKNFLERMCLAERNNHVDVKVCRIFNGNHDVKKEIFEIFKANHFMFNKEFHDSDQIFNLTFETHSSKTFSNLLFKYFAPSDLKVEIPFQKFFIPNRINISYIFRIRKLQYEFA